MQVTSKLPQVGTTIFSVMSQLADVYGAVNLGQGFPDFPVPLRLQEALAGAVREGHNQYPPMIGVAGLRQGIAAKVLRCYGAQVDADVEITVTSGATEAILMQSMRWWGQVMRSLCLIQRMTVMSRGLCWPVRVRCMCHWMR